MLCPFFRANFFFGGQKFVGKQDKDRSDNGERHGKDLFFAKVEAGVFLYAVKAGRWQMNLLAAKIYNDGSNWIAITHTEKPYKPRRQRKKREKSEELQQFETAFTKSKGKRTKSISHLFCAIN